MKIEAAPYPRGIAQERFARVLQIGTIVAIVSILATFGLYLAGVPEPIVPPDRVPEFWGLSALEYGRAVNREFLHLPWPPHGWYWVKLLPHASYYLNFVGITILALVTLPAFVAILPILFSQRRWAYFIFGVLELAVLTMAASGILPVYR